MDQMVPVIIVLFILCLITEKITGFIRSNIWHLREFWNRPAKYFGWKKRFLPPTGEMQNSKSIENQVSLLTIAVGFGVAFFSNASIFGLLQIQSLPMHKFYLDDLSGSFDVGYWGGCLLCSFFLSIGSKFFHDLLSLVVQTKNLKKKLNEPEVYSFDKISQLEQMLSATPGDYAQMAFDKYEKQLLQIPNVSWISKSIDSDSKEERYLINIYLKDDNSGNIPNVLHLQLPNGLDYPVKTKIVKNCGEITAHFGDINMGTGIGNMNSEESGSLGCFLKNNEGKYFFLTCYHVVQNGLPDHYEQIYSSDKVSIVNRSQGNLLIGELIHGEINKYFDIALIKIEDNIDINLNFSCKNLTIKGVRKIDDTIKNTPITFNGFSSKCSKGYVMELLASTSDVVFTGGLKRTFKDVLVLQRNGSRLSDKGDSGSVIVDSKGLAVGLVFAGDNKHTFAFRMDSIKNQLNGYSFI